MPELVSILIPAYNAERWIANTLTSATAQDWPRKEIIVVDDGSIDGTLAVARSFSAANVKVLSQRNAGASAARNRALAEAQGDYIQWLDADDLLAPDKISRQLAGAEPGATSRVLLSSAFGEFFGEPGTADFVPGPLWEDLDPVEFLLRRFTRNAWMCPAVWLVSRRLTDLAGGWDERLSLDDDGEYFSRVAAKSRHIRFSPEARVYYRRGNVGSLSRAVSDRACESLLLSLTLCIEHLRSVEDSERSRAAGITLLQTCIDHSVCFYPGHQDLQARIEAVARELGGSVCPPRLNWKYAAIRALLGWSAVKRVKTTVSNMKLLARSRFARLRLPTSRRSPLVSCVDRIGANRTEPGAERQPPCSDRSKQDDSGDLRFGVDATMVGKRLDGTPADAPKPPTPKRTCIDGTEPDRAKETL